MLKKTFRHLAKKGVRNADKSFMGKKSGCVLEKGRSVQALGEPSSRRGCYVNVPWGTCAPSIPGWPFVCNEKERGNYECECVNQYELS